MSGQFRGSDPSASWIDSIFAISLKSGRSKTPLASKIHHTRGTIVPNSTHDLICLAHLSYKAKDRWLSCWLRLFATQDIQILWTEMDCDRPLTLNQRTSASSLFCFHWRQDVLSLNWGFAWICSYYNLPSGMSTVDEWSVWKLL